MLEARCEQITQYNDKLLTLRDQINTEKNYIQLYKNQTSNELLNTKNEVAGLSR